MPTPRLHPDRPQTGKERAKRSRESQRAYLAALEAAVCDAYEHDRYNDSLGDWAADHAATISRARAAQTEKED